MAKQLKFLSDKRLTDIRENAIKRGLDGLTEKISELDIEIAPVIKEQPKITVNPKFSKLDIAERATKSYKENIKPQDYNEPKFEDEDKVTASLPSIQYNARALSRSLIGIRNGGDAGKSSLPAGPNGGNVGVGPASISVMSVEEYEDYIDKLFISEEEVEVEEPKQELLVEEDGPVEELEQQLMEMSDHTWQAIDLVMRRIAREHSITPKQLHKEFKSKHGMIPDDWAKEQEVVEQVGWMPLDEMTRINQQGQVFEVSFLHRGGRQRLKFFWPEVGYPSHQDMQEACQKFWPAARLLAYYPVHDTMSSSAMVMLPAMKENFEVIPDDMWEFMSEEDSEIYDEIAAEEGEPVSAVYLTEDEDAFEMDIEDHDTGEVRTVVFGEGKKGLWDNIHAKRKRGEKPAKPGDKDYPKTLNVEGLSQARKNVGASTCWDGYKAKGTKKKGGKEVPNCVKEDMSGMSQKSGDKRSTESGAGMTAKGVAKYNRRTGGNLKTAVTTPPSKLKPGSKAANRRKSFCARSRSWNGERGKAARRRWNC